MGTDRLHTELLAYAGRLLLEYNESSGEIHRTLTVTAHSITEEECDVVVSYDGVAVSIGGNGSVLIPVRELRYNAALQARVHTILSQVRRRELDPAIALAELKNAEGMAPPHSRFLSAVVLGVAAASLAGLLGADRGAVIVAGFSTGLGLGVRQELGIRHFSLLTLPLSAAFIGALLGGFAIRLGWTRAPGLVLIVPSLMLIPGPHLINGILDLIDNYVATCVARLTLATGIIIASALGIVLGIELTLPGPPAAGHAATADHLNVFSDMFLAGIVTCGFAIFYKTAWTHIGLSTLGGMAGHGLRFLTLDAGWRLEAATFLGCLVVGFVSAWIAKAFKAPFAVIAFAGAVTMMPGVQIYRALAGSLHVARQQTETEVSAIGSTFGDFVQSGLVVGALALGLIVAYRTFSLLAGERGLPTIAKH
jgi:uncharacterized membrane protein YjjB (DUF3815 family)